MHQAYGARLVARYGSGEIDSPGWEAAGSTFLIDFEAGCNLDLAFVFHCAGNRQVNGGTGAYSTVKGTGTFTETQTLDENSAGTGFTTLTGTMHIDP